MCFNSGNIVRSITGRDKGNIYIILSIKDNYAYVCNGKNFNLDNPKKKNIKHINLIEKNCNLDFKCLHNCDIIYRLKNL